MGPSFSLHYGLDRILPIRISLLYDIKEIFSDITQSHFPSFFAHTDAAGPLGVGLSLLAPTCHRHFAPHNIKNGKAFETRCSIKKQTYLSS